MAETFADVLKSVLSDWSKFFKFFLLFAACGGCLAGLFLVVVHSLPKQAEEVQIEGLGRVIFSQKTKEGQSYIVVVHPQGWQETSIAVNEGDRISLDADGSVQIDLGGLVDSVRKRQDFEAQNAGRPFTAEQWDQIKPRWSWTNPDGNHSTRDLANPERVPRSLAPDHDYGALLAAIREPGVVPLRTDVLYVGTHTVIQKASKTGKLYFTVNDVWDDQDKKFPEKFFADNVGFFYVRVLVKSAS